MYLSYFPLLPKGVCYHPIGVGHHKHWDQVLMGQKHISINPFISILIFDSWILNIDYSEHLYKEHGGIIDCLYHIVLLLFLEALWISFRIVIWHLVENLVNKREGQYKVFVDLVLCEEQGTIKFSRTLYFVKRTSGITTTIEETHTSITIAFKYESNSKESLTGQFWSLARSGRKIERYLNHIFWIFHIKVIFHIFHSKVMIIYLSEQMATNVKELAQIAAGWTKLNFHVKYNWLLNIILTHIVLIAYNCLQITPISS